MVCKEHRNARDRCTPLIYLDSMELAKMDS